jgi:hypothetical protein
MHYNEAAYTVVMLLQNCINDNSIYGARSDVRLRRVNAGVRGAHIAYIPCLQARQAFWRMRLLDAMRTKLNPRTTDGMHKSMAPYHDSTLQEVIRFFQEEKPWQGNVTRLYTTRTIYKNIKRELSKRTVNTLEFFDGVPRLARLLCVGDPHCKSKDELEHEAHKGRFHSNNSSKF